MLFSYPKWSGAFSRHASASLVSIHIFRNALTSSVILVPGIPRYRSTAFSKSPCTTARPTLGVTGLVAPNLCGPIQFGKASSPRRSAIPSLISKTLLIASLASRGEPSTSQHPRTVIVNRLPSWSLMPTFWCVRPKISNSVSGISTDSILCLGASITNN